jgi:hypothetical protein
MGITDSGGTMSKSLKYRAETKKNKPIAAAEPIFNMGMGSRGLVREVRCGTPIVVQTRIPTASFGTGKRDTLFVVVDGRNRRQRLTLKARKPFSAEDVLQSAKRAWEMANPTPKSQSVVSNI